MPLFTFDENGLPVFWNKNKREIEFLARQFSNERAKVVKLQSTIEDLDYLLEKKDVEIYRLSRELDLERKAHDWRTRERDILLSGGEIEVALHETTTAEWVNNALAIQIDELTDLNNLMLESVQVANDKIERLEENLAFLGSEDEYLVAQRNKLSELSYGIRTLCDEADARRASEGRSGRVGTKQLRDLL